MNLTNNELTYEEGDAPKDFSFADWRYWEQTVRALSSKIDAVLQRGIYGNEPRRFALETSGDLTDQEKIDILAAWTAFDATSLKAAEKSQAVEELRIQLGIKTKAYMGYLCEVNNLTLQDYEAMLGDVNLTMLDRLLLNGALQSSKSILDAYTPTSYFNSSFISSLSSKLQEYINQVDSFIASI